MYLRNIFIKNMGPFESFQLLEGDLFNEKGLPKPIIFVGKNGSGKTTLLSTIVDSLYELANKSFEDVLPKNGAGYRYYKISGAKNVRVGENSALSFVQFGMSEQRYEYVDKNGNLTFEDAKLLTNNLLTLNSGWINEDNLKKSTNTSHDKQFIEDIKKNSYCFFPADRYELPYWINKEFVAEQIVESEPVYNKRLSREIQVRSALKDIKSWILNVFLDTRADIVFDDKGNPSVNRNVSDLQLLKKSVSNIEQLISNIVEREVTLNLNFRGQGNSRIRLIDSTTNKDFIPSLDNLSAGQSTLLSIFGTIIRYSDSMDINKSIDISQISGIVVIDEIDLHLHIELQYTVLPELMKLFPKVQFIVTSHSPFFLSGLSDSLNESNYLVINLPAGNIIRRTDEFEQFNTSLKIFNILTQSYKEELDKIKSIISEQTKPLILTEGKTDWKYLKAAFKKLKNEYDEIDLFFLDYEEEIKMGSKALLSIIDAYSKIPNEKMIIAIFDRDEDDILKRHSNKEYVRHGNNVYSLCIPKISDELDPISLEYYFSKDVLKIQDSGGRRLFDSNEFYSSGNSKCGSFQLKDRNKTRKLGIIDSGVYTKDDLEWENNIALSKNDFANYIYSNTPPFDNVDFSQFSLIFDIVKIILEEEKHS